MTLALLILSALVLGQFMVIWQLINRLLAQAHLTPLNMPSRADTEIPAPVPLRKRFSVPIGEV